MIFLRDNVLLERKITSEDIKNRLLGHWGTCPGLSLVHAHLNRLIIKHDLDILYVVGPGESLVFCCPYSPSPQLALAPRQSPVSVPCLRNFCLHNA